MGKAKKKPAIKTTIHVVIDTREKAPLVLENDNYTNFIVYNEALKTGDYSIKGLESAFVIERKASTSEIAGNIFEDRFDDELHRMAAFPYKFILCEFTLRDVLNFPINSGIPKYKWKGLKITGNFLLKKLVELEVNYGVPIIYAGDHATDMAIALIKKINKDLNG